MRPRSATRRHGLHNGHFIDGDAGQLFGNDAPIWNRQCPEGSRRPPELLRALMEAARSYPLSNSDSRQPCAWAAELPLVLARLYREPSGHSSRRSFGNGQRCLSASPGEGTRPKWVLSSVDSCHLLLHLLDVARRKAVLDYMSVLEKLHEGAATLARVTGDVVGVDGLWLSMVSLCGAILSSCAEPCLGEGGVSAAIGFANVVVGQLSTLAQPTQTAVVALVYVLRTCCGIRGDECVVVLAQQCAAGGGSTQTKRAVGQMIQRVYAKQDLPYAILPSLRVLAGDADTTTRAIWSQLLDLSPLRVSGSTCAIQLPGGGGSNNGLGGFDSQAMSRCVGAFSESDAMRVADVVVKSALDSVRRTGCGLSDVAMHTIEALHYAAGLETPSSVYAAATAVVAAAARKLSPETCLPVTRRLFDVVRVYVETSDSSSNGLYWALELLFGLSTRDSGGVAAMLGSDIQLLLLAAEAAALCRNAAYTAYLWQLMASFGDRGATRSSSVAALAKFASVPLETYCTLSGSLADDLDKMTLAAGARLGVFDESVAGAVEDLSFAEPLFTDTAAVLPPPQSVISDWSWERSVVYKTGGVVTAGTLSPGPRVLRWSELADVQKLCAMDLCLRHVFVDALDASTALQRDIDVGKLGEQDLHRWWAMYTASSAAAAYDANVAPLLDQYECMAVVDSLPVEGRMNICFALLPGATELRDRWNSRLALGIDTPSKPAARAKEALLYYYSSARGGLEPEHLDELYTRVLMDGQCQIRRTAQGAFDAASQLISHIMTNPSTAPALTTDSLSADAVRLLAAYIPQLLALLCAKPAGEDGSNVSASSRAFGILRLLTRSAPDVVVFYVTVAANTLPPASRAKGLVDRLLVLFDVEQVAAIRAFLCCIEQVAILPQEHMRRACIKAKAAHANAMTQSPRNQRVQAVDDALSIAYRALDENRGVQLLSPAERDFVGSVPRLRKQLDRLRYSDADGWAQGVEETWKEILQALGTATAFGLDYICPRFAELTAAIPIPRLTSPEEPLYFAHIGNWVRTIASKTRPKLLSLDLRAVDGALVRENFILKGSEDLRIDECIMQSFIRLNGTSSLGNPLPNGMRLAVYNIVPTGLYGGLIQVVDGAPSLYSIHTRRERLKGQDKLEGVRGPQQAFAEHGRRCLESTGHPANLPPEKWPSDVVRQVYGSLCRSVEPDLLYRSLLHAAQNSAHLLLLQRSMAESIGMTSMAGYVVGLGDRHLDNLLVDIGRGRLVHVDFNVCFDFGDVSRIPELVPFRMTPALAYLCAGKGGAAGTRFTQAAELALGAARMDKEAVWTLVNGTRFRPFVEWSLIEESWCQDAGSVGLLSSDSGPEPASPTELIRGTGLCPPGSFWPRKKAPESQSPSEMLFGWRIADAAVDRVRARLSYEATGTQHEAVSAQVRGLWDAATSTTRLARMFPGWAPWV